MIPRIVLLFYRSSLSMVARERISNENNVHFILFSIPIAKSKYLENFPEGFFFFYTLYFNS